MTVDFQVCLNCGTGQTGCPHSAACPRPKYVGTPNADAPRARSQVPIPRTYLILVRETRLFWDQVEVRAMSADEAEELARDQYQLDWSESAELSVVCEVLEVKP